MLAVLIGTAVGAVTYWWTKHGKRTPTGGSAIAGVAAGAIAAGVAMLVSWLALPMIVIGLPLGAAYYLGKSRSQAKALKSSGD
ncbi:MAG: hypothetical protein V3V08_06070 [Nannocystaceae bacterium]